MPKDKDSKGTGDSGDSGDPGPIQSQPVSKKFSESETIKGSRPSERGEQDSAAPRDSKGRDPKS